MQKSSIWVLGEEAAAAGGASLSFQGKNMTRLPEGKRTWPKLLEIDKTFLTLWCYFCFACNAYCPSAHPAAAACLASCPLFQWPCPFIILSLFVPPPLHPAPILTVGIKAHHFGLVRCYTENKKHIVRFFVEMFQSCLITLLLTNSATFCNTNNESLSKGVSLFFTAPHPKEEFYCFASYFIIRKHLTFGGTSLNRIIFPLLLLDPVWAVSVSHDLSACSLSLVICEHFASLTLRW